MRIWSLSRRVVLVVVVLESLCAMALVAAAGWHEYRTRLRALDVAMMGRSDSLLGAIQDAEDPDDNVLLDSRELRLPAGDRFAVYNRQGRLLGASPSTAPELLVQGPGGYRDVAIGGKPFRVLQRRGMRIIDRNETEGAGLQREVTIVLVAPLAFLRHEVGEALSFDLIAAVTLVGGTTVVLLVLLRRLLRPMQLLATEAGRLNPAALAFTPPAEVLAVAELRPLAEGMSAAVARLRRAIEAEQHFIGDAAHELKTSVAVVRSSVQVLTMRPRSPEEYRGGLRRILEDNERVEELIARMLTSMRFQQAPMGTAVPVPLATAIGQAVARLNSVAEAQGVHLGAELADGLQAAISAEAVQTLVSNLVVNAIQHSPRGAEVRVNLRRSGSDDAAAVLEVIDCGEGIAAESLPFVFDRFYREDSSRSRATGGAGLGLAICKGIMEAAGGLVELESAKGQGTTVRAVFRLS